MTIRKSSFYLLVSYFKAFNSKFNGFFFSLSIFLPFGVNKCSHGKCEFASPQKLLRNFGEIREVLFAICF